MTRGDGEEGQAAAELALLLPLLALLALALVQVGLVVRDQVLVVHAAREAVRAAAVDAAPEVARRAGLRAAPLKMTGLSVDISGGGSVGRPVTAVLEYRSPTDVPLIGSFVPDVRLGAKATMRFEGDEASLQRDVKREIPQDSRHTVPNPASI